MKVENIEKLWNKHRDSYLVIFRHDDFVKFMGKYTKISVSENEIIEIAKGIADRDGGGLWGDYYISAKKGIESILIKLKNQ